MLHAFNDVFKDGHLALDNQLVYSFLGKTISLTPNFNQLPTVLYVGLRPRGLSLASSLMASLFRPCVGGHVLKEETAWLFPAA